MQDVDDGDEWKIFTIFTSFDELRDFSFLSGRTRPLFAVPEGVDEDLNWKEYIEAKGKFEKEDPAVNCCWYVIDLCSVYALNVSEKLPR